MTPPIQIHFINTDHALAEACAHLSKQPWITLDTEFMREKTYWPEPALFQASSAGLPVYLIDPLAGMDLSPFWTLLVNPNVIKVLHSGRQDIETFWKMSKTIPHPLFDTQTGAFVAGLGDQLGYESLVKQFLGHAVDKSNRLTNWKQRPLTDMQIQYAAADVTHLCGVYEALSGILKTLDRADWISDEVDLLQDPATYDIVPEKAWERFKNKNNIIGKNYSFGVLKTICAWRETYAQTHDISRSSLFKDEAVYEILRNPPLTIKALSKIRGIPVSTIENYGEELLTEIALGLTDLTPFPTIPSWTDLLSPHQAQMAEHLRLFFQAESNFHSLPLRFLIGHPEAVELLLLGEQTPLLKGWRKRVYGDKILALLEGKAGLRFTGKQVQIVPVSFRESPTLFKMIDPLSHD